MNMQNLMAQAQKMQREITKKKEAIDNSEFTGKSEWVEITINGKKEILSFKIIYPNPIENDDKEMLEDMVKIAFNAASQAVDQKLESEMGAYSSLGGLF